MGKKTKKKKGKTVRGSTRPISNYSTKKSTIASRSIQNPLKKLTSVDIESLGSYRNPVKFGETSTNFTIRCKREN